MPEMTKPTKTELENAIRMLVNDPDIDLVVDDLIARGWVEVAPPPIPEPRDQYVAVVDRDGGYWWPVDFDGERRWCCEGSVACSWETVCGYGLMTILRPEQPDNGEARLETDGRIKAWYQLCQHPAFRPAHDVEDVPLIDAMLDRLTYLVETEKDRCENQAEA